MQTDRSQRWRERRALWARDLELIDPSAYRVEVIDHAVARAFIARHHYLPTYPAAQVAVGLFDRSGALEGVAVFAVPTTGAVISRHTGFDDPARGCVLARLILTDAVPQNGESFFVARAFRHLRRERPGIEAVVSYSDPGAGHIGRVYCALSAAHRAITRPRTMLRVGDITISGRTLSKIRLGEQGHAGAIDQLVALGVPRPSISASIIVGGTLNAAEFDELVDIIASERLAIEWDGEPFEAHHHVAGEPLSLFAHEVAGGSFDDLESWCLSHRLPFVRWCGGYSGQWGPERVVSTGDERITSYAVTEDDEVVISRSKIEMLGSFEAVLAHFDTAEFTVPPLVVRGVDADNPASHGGRHVQ